MAGTCSECDRGFIVMNRPWGVVQFVESAHFRERIPEDYILLIETDHMMMKPLENSATPELPIGFGFYYMLGTDPKLKPVVQQFLDPSISPDTVDAVGPSPILLWSSANGPGGMQVLTTAPARVSPQVDAVGPSPILIHKPLLRKLARPWWDMSQRMQHDNNALNIFGWVLEMWGYSSADDP